MEGIPSLIREFFLEGRTDAPRAGLGRTMAVRLIFVRLVSSGLDPLGHAGPHQGRFGNWMLRSAACQRPRAYVGRSIDQWRSSTADTAVAGPCAAMGGFRPLPPVGWLINDNSYTLLDRQAGRRLSLPDLSSVA